MLFRDTVNILICDPSFIGIGTVYNTKGSLSVEAWREIPFNSLATTADDWLKMAAQYIEANWGKLNMPGKTYAVLPLEYEFFKWMRVPKVQARHQKTILKHEIQQRLPYLLDDVYLGQTCVHEGEPWQDVHFYAIKRTLARDFIHGFKKSGITLAGILPASLLDYYSTRYVMGEEDCLIVRTAPNETLITINYKRGFYARKGVNPSQTLDPENEFSRIRDQFQKHTGYPLPNKLYKITDDENNTFDFSKGGNVCLKKTLELVNKNTVISKLIGASILTKEAAFFNLTSPNARSNKSFYNTWIATAAAVLVIVFSIQVVVSNRLDLASENENDVKACMDKIKQQEAVFIQLESELQALADEQKEWSALAIAKSSWKSRMSSLEEIFKKHPFAWIESLTMAPSAQNAILLRTKMLSLGKTKEEHLSTIQKMADDMEGAFGKGSLLSLSIEGHDSEITTLALRVGLQN